MSTQQDHTPPFDYTWDEWSAHMQLFLRTNEPSEAVSHFQAEYSNPQEAKWKFVRFVAARSFLEINHGKFQEFYVRGRPRGEPAGGVITHELVGALWRYFSAAPDDLASPHVPLETILELAREPR